MQTVLNSHPSPLILVCEVSMSKKKQLWESLCLVVKFIRKINKVFKTKEEASS